ncbi:hypothetical protein CPB84DRAFT_1873596 [Gymnopilus junonius]|uniref:Lysine-specific metallo-endopeptidase domain-containing protein n=1 Tax=Gymnopilus junonius TaxID=109634 RepID=A0A9P5NF07_GYMJU|nr:hypothetical protein CPB84DRAFT_1873596 [Gymnopilus junonius]
MRSAIYLAILMPFFAVFVQCAPLPLEVGTVYGHDDLYDQTIVPTDFNGATDHTQASLANVHAAVNEAHNQIMNIKKMMDENHPDLHAHLTNAFGPNYNKEEIHKTINRLATGKIDIAQTNAPNDEGNETTNAIAKHSSGAQADRVVFYEKFHRKTLDAQAGTVIHEATHALARTKDHFREDPNQPGKFEAVSSKHEGNPGVMKAYAHSEHFDHLKTHASEVMHQNADSYMVLAHTVKHGLPQVHQAANSNANPNVNAPSSSHPVPNADIHHDAPGSAHPPENAHAYNAPAEAHHAAHPPAAPAGDKKKGCCGIL